eukprot:scaffold66168_cov66-Phaeocystis_antarctica.AAC.5
MEAVDDLLVERRAQRLACRRVLAAQQVALCDLQAVAVDRHARVVGVAEEEDAVGDLAPHAAQLAQRGARLRLLERQATEEGLAPALLELACYLEDARRAVAPAQLPQPLLREAEQLRHAREAVVLAAVRVGPEAVLLEVGAQVSHHLHVPLDVVVGRADEGDQALERVQDAEHAASRHRGGRTAEARQRLAPSRHLAGIDTVIEAEVLAQQRTGCVCVGVGGAEAHRCVQLLQLADGVFHHAKE